MNTSISAKTAVSQEMINELCGIAESIIDVSEDQINRALEWALKNEEPRHYYTKDNEENCFYVGDYAGKEGYTFDHDEDAYAVIRLRNMKPGKYATDGHNFYGNHSYEDFVAENGDELSEIEYYIEKGLLSTIDGIGIMDNKIIGLYNSSYFSVNPVICLGGHAHICTASCGGVVKNIGGLEESIKEYNKSYDKMYEENSKLDMRHLKILAYMIF